MEEVEGVSPREKEEKREISWKYSLSCYIYITVARIVFISESKKGIKSRI